MNLYMRWLSKLREDGAWLVDYFCPHCFDVIETPKPIEDTCWDSLVNCPHCGGLHFRKVYSDGVIEVGTEGDEL